MVLRWGLAFCDECNPSCDYAALYGFGLRLVLGSGALPFLNELI